MIPRNTQTIIDQSNKEASSSHQFEIGAQLDNILHNLAGVVVLIFAFSHFAFLITPDISSNLRLQNIVFTMLTDWEVYLMAAIFEIIVGVSCLLFRGTSLINYIIIIFVGLVLWYRWAFFFSGGVHCNCLGYIGRLFHVGKTAEKILPVSALIMLIFTAAPYFFRIVKGHFRYTVKVFIILSLFMPRMGLAVQSLQVDGEYNAANYNPSSTSPQLYEGTQIHATFEAKISDQGWFISVSNIYSGETSQLWFDGTNTFTLNKMQLGINSATQIVATVSPRTYYIPGNQDYINISIPWLVYGLSPRFISTNDQGLVEIPLPWLIPRYHPDAFGYKWLFTPSNDGRFISEAKIIRDQSLDVSTNQEMLRPDLIYPDNVAWRNKYYIDIDTRSDIPTGFMAADYKSEQWYHTNGWSVPMDAKVEFFWPDFKLYTNAWLKGSLTVHQIKLFDHPVEFPQPIDTTKVIDFRYRQFDGVHLYRSAIYTLEGGEPWKSGNDPVLLAQANNYLKHAPRYDDLSLGFGKRIIVWLVFVVLLLIPPAVMLYIRKINKKKRT